jgi:hypothetical protein
MENGILLLNPKNVNDADITKEIFVAGGSPYLSDGLMAVAVVWK